MWLAYKRILSRITLFSILPWKAGNSSAICSVKCTKQLFSTELYRTAVNIEIEILGKKS